MVYDAGWSVYPTPHKPTGGAASWPHSVVSSVARRHALMSCILHDCAACARLSWQGRARRWSPWRARPLTSSGPPPSNIPAHPPRTRSALILSVVRLARRVKLRVESWPCWRRRRRRGCGGLRLPRGSGWMWRARSRLHLACSRVLVRVLVAGRGGMWHGP